MYEVFGFPDFMSLPSLKQKLLLEGFILGTDHA